MIRSGSEEWLRDLRRNGAVILADGYPGASLWRMGADWIERSTGGASSRMRCPADAFALFSQMIKVDRECVAIAYVDALGRLIAIEAGDEGDAQGAPLPAARILRHAVAHGAEALLVAHNHPSDNPMPSLTDIRATRRLADASEAVGIRLLDHVVIARGGCSSMRALGML